MRCQTLWAAALAATMIVAGTPDAWAKKHERHKAVPAAPSSSAPASAAPAAQAPSGTQPNSSSAPVAAPLPAAPTPATAVAPETLPASAPPAIPPTSAAPPENPSTPPPPAPTISIDKEEVQTILGKNVRDAAGDDMGRVIDVVVDRAGQTLAAIIDFGGFLGVGSRKIAVDWKALQFSPNDPKGNTISLGLTRDQVKSAPEYKEGSPVVVLGASGGLQSMPPAHPQALEK
jgi:sporulation protein YlmC with PRC-barrel domain